MYWAKYNEDGTVFSIGEGAVGEDCVQITREQYDELLAEIIRHAEENPPVPVEPTPTAVDIALEQMGVTVFEDSAD